MSTYLLSKHVFLCLSGGQVVLLDLKNDRYMSLDAARARPLARLVRGWPVPEEASTDGTASTDDSATLIARVMTERGLLTTNGVLGKEVTPPALGLPSATLLPAPTILGPGIQTQRPIRLWHVAAFASATVMAAAKLRWRPIERVAGDVGHRKTRQLQSSRAFDMDDARELVAIFYRLRPFAFTARNACLFDSLALLNFLSRYGMFPRWVFGVRTAPFAAHCWVQEGDVVFNDSVVHAGFYTPIMVV